ncbi:hypothetical protein [Nocardioides montaniterrae]
MDKMLKMAATAVLVLVATVSTVVPADAATHTLAPQVNDSCC